MTRAALRRRDDEGTVLLLTIGLSVVLLLLVAVVVDVSKVVLVKRALASAADGAAVAAAQHPDLARLREPGALEERLPLDGAEVAAVVATYAADAAVEQQGLELVGRVDGTDDTVAVVEGRRTVRLPFSGWLGLPEVEVRAVARSRSPVAP